MLSHAKAYGKAQADHLDLSIDSLIRAWLVNCLQSNLAYACVLQFGGNVKSALGASVQCRFLNCLTMLALSVLAAVAPAQPPRMTGGVRQGAQGGSRLIRVPAAAHP